VQGLAKAARFGHLAYNARGEDVGLYEQPSGVPIQHRRG
jgi:hypothetical protein